jgi:hypothetical protein
MSSFGDLRFVVFKVRPGGCSARAYNRGPSRGRSPICPGTRTGTLPRPRPQFVGDGDAPPYGADSHRSGGPRPARRRRAAALVSGSGSGPPPAAWDDINTSLKNPQSLLVLVGGPIRPGQFKKKVVSYQLSNSDARAEPSAVTTEARRTVFDRSNGAPGGPLTEALSRAGGHWHGGWY